MLRNLFRLDSALMIAMLQITDCIFLSLVWFLCAFPVVTAGASFAALYDATYQTFRREEKHSRGRFFDSFRRNLKASVLPLCLTWRLDIPSRAPPCPPLSAG